MAVGIELARAMEPLTFFQMKVFNAQLAIRYKSATQLNTQTYCEKTRYRAILLLWGLILAYNHRDWRVYLFPLRCSMVPDSL